MAQGLLKIYVDWRNYRVNKRRGLILYPMVYNDRGTDIYFIVNESGRRYPPDYMPHPLRNQGLRSTDMKRFSDLVFNDGFTIDLLRFRVPKGVLKAARAHFFGGENNIRKFNPAEVTYYKCELEKVRKREGRRDTYHLSAEELEELEPLEQPAMG